VLIKKETLTNRVEYQNWSDISIHSSFILDKLAMTILLDIY
jgi:hypothetical protein